MKFKITINKPGKKKIVAQGRIASHAKIEDLRKVWEAEQALNALPSDLRFHFDIEEEDQ